MKAGIVIEDNFVKLAYVENNGKATVHKQSVNKSDYESTFILEDNLCYTTMTLENVKLANPKLEVFSNVLTNPKKSYTTAKGRKWNSRQLMAILFKKILHDVNANSIEEINSVTISLPPESKDSFEKDIDLCLKANGIESTEYINYADACQAYTSNKVDDKAVESVFVNLSDQHIYILGKQNTTSNGFADLDAYFIHQLEVQNDIIISELSKIEQYLITAELRKIKEQVLKNIKKKEHIILLIDSYLVLHINFIEIRETIEKLLVNVKQTLLDSKSKVVTITGRMSSFSLIEEICNQIFTHKEFTEVIIDAQNEIKARGLLLN